MTKRTEGVVRGNRALRWLAGGGVLAIAVLLFSVALTTTTVQAAGDGVYNATASVVEEGQCGGGTIDITVSNNTITRIFIDGSIVGGVPLDDFDIPDLSIAIVGDAVNETFEPLPGLATTLEVTFSGDSVSGVIGVESLMCVGIAFSGTLAAGGGMSAPTTGVGPIGGPGSGVTFWAVIAGSLAVLGLAVTGAGARIARRA